MPKITVTNYQMLQIRNEINEYSGNSITFALFNKEKISRFLKLNSIRLNAADDHINRLIKKFVKHGADGNPIKLDEKEGHVKWDYVDENAKKAFDIEYQDMMKKQITIEL